MTATDSGTRAPGFLVHTLTRKDPRGFIIRVIPLLALLIFATTFDAFEEYVQEPFMRLNAWMTHVGINVFGAQSELSDNKVWTGKFAVTVVPACTGQFTLLILFSMLMAFPASLSMKLRGLVTGFLLILGLNLIRLVSLFFIGEAYPEIFDDVHLYVWQAITITVALLFWYFWARRALRGLEAPRAGVEEGP